MLRSLNSIKNFSLEASDGPIGSIKDAYFDDSDWKVRYFVVDTGGWLSGRKVLVPPVECQGRIDWPTRSIPVKLTRQQVEGGPGIHEAMPVSQEKEAEFLRHYNWAWYGAALSGTSAVVGLPPIGVELTDEGPAKTAPQSSGQESHLRSFNEVRGYAVSAVDDRVGHIDDLIVDDESWEIRYLAVGLGDWLPARKVLLAPDWIKRISWEDHAASVEITREQLESSPAYDPSEPVNREYELRLYDFYGWPH